MKYIKKDKLSDILERYCSFWGEGDYICLDKLIMLLNSVEVINVPKIQYINDRLNVIKKVRSSTKARFISRQGLEAETAKAGFKVTRQTIAKWEIAMNEIYDNVDEAATSQIDLDALCQFLQMVLEDMQNYSYKEEKHCSDFKISDEDLVQSLVMLSKIEEK